VIFGPLSIAGMAPPIQPLKKGAVALRGAAWRFFGQDCALCGGRGDGALVCGGCEAQLPCLRECCVRCAVPMPRPGVCGACLRTPPAFDGVLAAFEYRFPVDRLIHRFKFGGDLALGRWLAERIAERAREVALPGIIVVPPLTPVRLRERGFNQALELAKVVGSTLGARVERGALEKVRETAPQRTLGLGARQSNLRGAFRCTLALCRTDVAIVDDVVTTGATVGAVAAALRRAGAASVQAWAAARAP
jgi:ComF family protein